MFDHCTLFSNTLFFRIALCPDVRHIVNHFAYIDFLKNRIQIFICHLFLCSINVILWFFKVLDHLKCRLNVFIIKLCSHVWKLKWKGFLSSVFWLHFAETCYFVDSILNLIVFEDSVSCKFGWPDSLNPFFQSANLHISSKRFNRCLLSHSLSFKHLCCGFPFLPDFLFINPLNVFRVFFSVVQFNPFNLFVEAFCIVVGLRRGLFNKSNCSLKFFLSPSWKCSTNVPLPKHFPNSYQSWILLSCPQFVSRKLLYVLEALMPECVLDSSNKGICKSYGSFCLVFPREENCPKLALVIVFVIF